MECWALYTFNPPRQFDAVHVGHCIIQHRSINPLRSEVVWPTGWEGVAIGGNVRTEAGARSTGYAKADRMAEFASDCAN